MDVLRSQKCPITDEEMMVNRGADSKEVSEGKRSNSESSSPAVLSLMELLSSENLLDESTVPQKTTMFDFDTLKIAETLRSDPTLSGQSSEASSTQKSESPMFFLVDEKTPNYCKNFLNTFLIPHLITFQVTLVSNNRDYSLQRLHCPLPLSKRHHSWNNAIFSQPLVHAHLVMDVIWATPSQKINNNNTLKPFKFDTSPL